MRRRREANIRALQVVQEKGQIRADLDLEACLDAILGVFYYQSVARGVNFTDQGTMQRSLGGDLAWNGTLNSGSDEVQSKLSRAAPQYPDQLNFEVLGFLVHTQCVPMCP